MRKAIITGKLNTVYVRRGETKEVELTKQIQAAIDSGYVLDVTPAPKRTRKKVESAATDDG